MLGRWIVGLCPFDEVSHRSNQPFWLVVPRQLQLVLFTSLPNPVLRVNLHLRSLFLLLLEQIVVRTQNVFVVFLDQQLNRFWTFLNERESLVDVERVIMRLILNKGLEGNFFSKHLALFHGMKVGSFAFLPLSPFHAPIASCQIYQHSELKIRRKNVIANALKSILQLTVSHSLHVLTDLARVDGLARIV